MRQHNYFVDMHTHSYYSDGTVSPQEIADLAEAAGVQVLAIADHVSLTGAKELQRICTNRSLHAISAVELYSKDRQTDYHILAYGFDLQDEDFQRFVNRNESDLSELNTRLMARMENDFSEISMDEFADFTYPREWGGWKVLQYLRSKGLVETIVDTIQYYKQYDCAHASADFSTIAEICQAIHKANGYAVIAHPGIKIKYFDLDEFRSELLRLIDFGLDGVECFYPAHSLELTQVCVDICNERELLITSGSDFHGGFGKTEIGQLQTEIAKVKLGKLLDNGL
jgi:predicted metal-dependent phosphoesterase TrpH